MFFLQLRQLCWKNYVIRTRSKVRVLIELVWPLILFGILALVRTKGLKEYNNECFLEEKALPSAGSIAYLQSLLCTYTNVCHDTVPNTKYLTDDFQYEQARELISDVEKILQTRVTDSTAASGSKVSMNVAAGLAAAFKILNNGSLPGGVSLPLQSIINLRALKELTDRSNVTLSLSPSLLNSSLRLPSLEEVRSLQADPKQFVCNATVLRSFFPNVSADDYEVVGNLSELLCQLSTLDILSVLNVSSLLNQTRFQVEQYLGQPLHIDDWASLVGLSGTIFGDIRNLDSLYNMFRKIANTTVGQVAAQLWNMKSVGSDDSKLSMSFNVSSMASVASMLCGRNILNDANKTSAFVRRLEANRFRQPTISSVTFSSKTADSSRLTIECNQLFYALYNNPATRYILELLYPFIRGKLVYAPNTAPFKRVVEKIHASFQDLRRVQNLARFWLNKVSPAVRNITNQIDVDALANLSVQIIVSTFPPELVNVTISNVSEVLRNVESLIGSIKLTLIQVDQIARLVDVYTDCYEFDKFEGYPDESSAVKRGMELMNSSLLWAVIVFDSNGTNTTSSEFDLPPHISYKIRMDSGKIDSTKRLKDFFETPIPRTSPSVMKYFTSGYIFLQDKIEHAIIQLHTNRTRLPGMLMQQFPSPCYVYDTFFMAIAQLFPLFMILSFVYTCAMIVKSIVHEKERRLKETMRIMGLGNAVHWVAWFIDSMAFMLIACILLSLILVFGQVLEKSNFLIVLIFLLSFTISTICFSFLISTFFSRANLAAACGGFIFFVSFLPYNFLNLNGEDYSLSVMIGSSLLSDVAFGIGCWYFATFEQSGSGAQWNNIAISPKDGDSYSLLGCILMMLLDSVIYLTFTWYIEAVFPGQYGIPKPWYFMFQPSYWCSNDKNQRVFSGDYEPPAASELIEEESRNLGVGVSLRNLGKTYSNGKVAVQNLSLDFYQNQITSFLGHNGAGKTTTISILTGLYPPSSGTATINGLDIRFNMEKIRKQLGLCPQHNVLFDQLTVEEHLRFYGTLKTGERLETRKDIDKMIDDLGLVNKKYELSRHLSGGMKRRLSIGAAFIGNSKTVILDEPTAGVDPYSRRSIWDILLKFKAGRTIILTTHFMDEADLLGDRIAIISQGQLKCCGSSLFLKKKLGSGYYLTLVRKDGTESTPERSISQQGAENPDQAMPLAGAETEDVSSVVKRHIPNSFAVQDVGSDLLICLPEFDGEGQSQRDKFSRLFQELETKMDQLGLDSYGVSDTTLEEVFLKVADDPSDSYATNPADPEPVDVAPFPGYSRIAFSRPSGMVAFLQNGDRQNYRYEEAPQREESGSDSFNLVSSEKLKGSSLVLQQLFALYFKRFCNSKRNLKGFFCEVILPALFIVISQLTTMSINLTLPEPAIVLSPWLYGQSNTDFFANRNSAGYWLHQYKADMMNGTGLGVRCMAGNPLGLPCSDSISGLVNPFANSQEYQDLRCPCDLGIATCPANATEAELWRYRSISTDEFYDVTDHDINLWIVRTYKKMKKTRFGGFEFGVRNPVGRQISFGALSQDMESLALASRLEQLLQLDTAQKILKLENVTRILGTFDNIKVWFDNKAWASSVSYLNAINNVVLRASLPASAGDPKKYGITAINHPMNYTVNQLQEKLTRQVGVSILHAISVIFAMSFVPASFVIFLVEERVSKAKHLQFVAGVKPITFWMASYTWDLVNYIIPSFLVVIIFLAFDQQAYIGSQNIGGLIVLLILYGFASIPLMYPASLLFSIPSSAFVALACGNLFLGIITTISSFVLQLFDDEELKYVGSILNIAYLIFPHFCLGRGIIDMAQVYFTSQSLLLLGIQTESRNVFEWDFLGRYLVSMAVQAIVFFTFTLLLHYQLMPELVTRYFQKATLPPMDVEDEDVAKERARVEQEDQGSTDELRLLRLTKIYGRRAVPATDRLSFGLRKGECFGLLGVNGAGKTTTFKMLTGDESVTSGNAFISGYSVLSHLSDAQQNLGYCPQEDALLSLLTGVEHLKLFASLRGVPKRHLKKVVNDSLKKLSLLPYKNRCAGTYSGGNKRKLATAIALIGNPAVVFLDEPSSGMDPRARRSLWQVILDAVKDSRSVLLTSHSMEECQVLCTRLAIMVNGRLCCLGSAQHLKNRFGDGYMINVRCEIETVEEVLQSVRRFIPEATLREQRPRQLILHIKPNVLPISDLFSRMESARSESNMVDYSITQTTLDDVFVRFARLQREIHEDDDDQNLDELSEPPLGRISDSSSQPVVSPSAPQNTAL